MRWLWLVPLALALLLVLALLWEAMAQQVSHPISSPQEVPSNAALKTLTGSAELRAARTGFYTPGDGGYATYNWQAGNCTAADDGYQVQPAATGCWIADLSSRRAAAEVWGCAGDGTTDAASCLNRAATGLATAGGGDLVLAQRYLVAGEDFTIPPRVTARGPWARPGLVPGGNYTGVRGALVVSAARTVHVTSGGGIENIMVVRQGLLNPGAAGTTYQQNLQTAYAQRAAYSGTGITLGTGAADGSGSTTVVRDNLVLGFDRCIDAISQQLYDISRNYGDCTNGVRLRQVGELGTTAHNHFWPFLNYGGLDGTYENGLLGSTNFFYNVPITGIANNGSGLIRLTFAAGHAFETGNTVIVNSADAAAANNTEANPMWLVTKISGTVIDLQGSAFAAPGVTGRAYTTVLYREGEGYHFSDNGGLGCDHCSAVDNRAFGFKAGFRITNSEHVRIVAGRSDTWYPPLRRDTRGLVADGITSSLHVDGISLAAAGTLIEYNAAGGNVPPSFVNGANLWGCVGASVVVNAGTLTVSGGVVDLTRTSPYVTNCGAAANGVGITAGRLYLTGGIVFQNNAVTATGDGVVTVGDATDHLQQLLPVSTQLQRFNTFYDGIVLASESSAYVFGRPAAGYLDMQSSYCKAGTAPTANAAFDLIKNGAVIGAATFAAGATAATFAMPAGPWAVGDAFAFRAPAVADATLANVACTFAFGPR